MQLQRLDNMLAAEGVSTLDSRGNPINTAAVALAVPVSGQVSPSEGVIENSDYKAKLSQIRNVYHNEYEKYNQASITTIVDVITVFHYCHLCSLLFVVVVYCRANISRVLSFGQCDRCC